MYAVGTDNRVYPTLLPNDGSTICLWSLYSGFAVKKIIFHDDELYGMGTDNVVHLFKADDVISPVTNPKSIIDFEITNVIL